MSETCQQLHGLFHQAPLLAFPFDRRAIPLNGIYVLFEAGENGHGGYRIVRVGTHTGINQLPSRLEQHFLRANKDRSIFRKNIGRAILNGENDPFLAQWELDLTTRDARAKHREQIDFEHQEVIEMRVTEVIQRRFMFVAIRIDDKEMRLDLESKIIASVSWCTECGPSPEWLGLTSPVVKIRESGLWLVNGLYKSPATGNDLARLESLISSTGAL